MSFQKWGKVAATVMVVFGLIGLIAGTLFETTSLAASLGAPADGSILHSQGFMMLFAGMVIGNLAEINQSLSNRMRG